jgi:ABC-2 type transport system permease protein
MGKEVRTWWRDPIRGRFLRMGMWMAVFFGVLPVLAGASSMLPWIGPIAVLFMTAFAGNMYGFDGSALWLTLTTPGAACVDVRGRQLAWLLIVAPLAIALTVVLTFVSGQNWGWPLAATLLPALLGSGAGVIVFLSVLKMVPITDPHRRGRSIVLAGSDIDAGQLQVQGFLSLALMLVLVAPASAVTLSGLSTHRLDLQWVGVAIGMMTGLAVYWWFGRLASTRLETHGPEMLTLMTKGSVSRSSLSEMSHTHCTPDKEEDPVRIVQSFN